MSEMVHYIIR